MENLISHHDIEPHKRLLQNALADEITKRVHDKSSLELAKVTTNLLFGRSKKEDFDNLSQDEMESLSFAVPCVKIKREDLDYDLKSILTEKSDFKIFKSKSEISRLIKDNGLSINKVKIESEEYSLLENIKYNKYILLQKGKKNYTFIIVE